MTAATQLPTLEGLAQQLAALTGHVVALQQENVDLRATVARLSGVSPVDQSQPPHQAPALDATERMSRRSMLGRAVQVTAATLAAGALLTGESDDTSASHSTEVLQVNDILAHHIYAYNENGVEGILGTTTSEAGYSAVYGINYGAGSAVRGNNANELGPGVHGIGFNGVQGESPNLNASGVYGFNTGNGFGVAGDTTSAATAAMSFARAGVFGRNNGTGAGVLGLSVNDNGAGVWGTGKVGVHGTSASGNGVLGEGGSGYGGQFKGTRAQVRLTPTKRTGRPTTGYHQVGELYLDQVGALFICTAVGTPGTWRKMSTTLA